MKLRTKGAFALVAGILMMLIAAGPASAAVDLPDPVEPVKTLPSTYQRSIFTGSQLADNQMRFAAYALQQERARQAGTALGTTVAKQVPITQAAPYTRGAAGGALTLAFMGGWMITDGLLSIQNHTTGTNALSPTCGWGDFGSSAVQVLYPFSAPDCTVGIATPNTDATSGVLTYGALNVSFKGHDSVGRPCFYRSGAIPSGHTWQAADSTASGGWRSSGLTSTVTNCTTAYGSSVYYLAGGNYAEVPGNHRLVNTSSLTVVATSTTGNPGRLPKCDVTWPDGSTTTSTGASYKETTGLPLSIFNNLCNDAYVSKPGHGPGLLPSEIKIGSTNEETGAYTELQKSTVPEFTPDEQKGLTPGTSSGGLVLQRVVGTIVKSCMTWEADCANWWTATSGGTVPTVSDGYYRCLWNGSPVSLAECGIYRTTFDTQTSNPTITDPQTGTTSPWVTSPTTGSNPGTGTGTFPSTGANPGAAVSTATGGGGCTAGWSWNPVDWVLNPIRCAFIPSTESVDGTIAALGESAGSVAAVDPLLALLDTLPGAGGCEGIPVELTFFGQTASGHLLAACDGFGATAAAVVNGLMTLGIATGAVIAVTRYAAAVFGFVGPGGGIQQQEYSNHMMARSAARSD